ncbi:MAG: HAD hydrolase-like protein [bacterium]
MPRLKQVFFDLDGTLTDPKLGITRCIAYALAEMGEPVPDTQALTWCIGPPLLDSFVHLVGADRAQQGVALYRARFAEIGLFENNPYPNIHDTLEAIAQRGHQLFVASSKPKVFVDRILERYRLMAFFSQTYGSELDGNLTDKSELLAHALQHSAVNPVSALMIGDRKHDAIGARNNQMDFVGVLYGYGDQAEFDSVGVADLVSHHAELLDHLS